jgi:hypothetical protein
MHHELQTFKTIYKISERFLAWYSDNPLENLLWNVGIELNKCIGERVLEYKICSSSFVYAKIIIKQCYREYLGQL